MGEGDPLMVKAKTDMVFEAFRMVAAKSASVERCCTSYVTSSPEWDCLWLLVIAIESMAVA